jgi:2-polyprenyl-3-methyl-5-hydroxy-6-metoxy-1,4-benzoquinol methylase
MSITNYNSQASNWKRNKSMYPSDFIARPVVFDLFKKIGKNKIVLDVACGEGYFSRKMALIAKEIIAFDNSTQMIKLAKEQNSIDKYKINYIVADMTDINFLKKSSIDICICNFVVHYLRPDQYFDFFKNIEKILKPGGKLILSGPHPYFYLQNTIGGTMKYKNIKNFDYIKSRGEYFSGTIRTINNNLLNIGLYHSTMEDYLGSIINSGLKMEKFIELSAKQSLLKEYKKIGQLNNSPIYMVLQASK